MAGDVRAVHLQVDLIADVGTGIGRRSWSLLCEVESCLFMTIRMLFPPQQPEERWPVVLDALRPRDFCMAGKAKREHQLRIVVARHPVVDCDGALSTLSNCAARHGATITVAGEHDFPFATEVFGVLSLQRVAGRAKTLSQNVLPTAGSVHHALSSLPQTYP